MAIELSGDKKKFIKFQGMSPNNDSFSRTYSGLNVDPNNNGGTAELGMAVTAAAEFFAYIYAYLTNATFREMYYGTEEIVEFN